MIDPLDVPRMHDRDGLPAPNSYDQLKREHQRVQVTRALIRSTSYIGLIVGAVVVYRVGRRTYDAYQETRRRLSRIQRILKRFGLA